MKLLRRFLATMLGLTLALSGIVWVANGTIWNADYLSSVAARTNLATGLSSAMPAVTANVVPGADAQAAVAAAVTPEYVQYQLDQMIPAFVNAFRHGGSVPTLNLTGIASQLSVLSVPVPPTLAAIIDKPQPLIPARLDGPLHTLGRLTGQLNYVAAIVAVICIALLILISPRRRITSPIGGLWTGAVFLVIAAALVQLPPHLMKATLASSFGQPLVAPVQSFAQAIANDQSKRLLILAACLLVAAVILLLVRELVRIIAHMHRIKPEASSEA